VLTKADQILVDLAVRNHLISESEGTECMQAAAAEGLGAGEMMVRKQLIKERHLQSLERKLRKMIEADPSIPQTPAEVPGGAGPQPSPTAETFVPAAASPSGPAAMDATFVTSDPDTPAFSSAGAMVLFGQIAVSRHMVSQDDLDRGLRLQEQLASQGRPMRIGEILVRAQRLNNQQVQQVLEYQEKWIYKCGVCARRYNVSLSQEAALRCPACGGQLVQGSASDIAVEATAGAASSGLRPLAAASSSSQPSGADQRREPTPDDPAGLLGLTWKGYRIDSILGKGGMGAVYKAEQVSLRRPVALKVMLRASGQAHPGERERFEREAKLIGTLNHPNIVRVIHAEWAEDLCWFTMELVPGQDFKATLRSGTFPMGQGAAVVAKTARAMDFAHRKGIVHRDLKPQNVMIDADSGEPKVLDFGLAKNVDAEQLQQLTQMGAFLGTPSYMAPEQAGGDPTAIDARADVYALGAMLYEVLTGRPPFTAKKAIQVIRKVLKEDPVPCRQVFPQADARLEAIAMRCLRKDPAERFQTAGELADAIEQVIGRVSRSYERTESGTSATAPPEPPAEGEGGSKSKGFFGRLLGG
jgi:DNA-directed RNA polymerase subunit RPC12/RpoP